MQKNKALIISAQITEYVFHPLLMTSIAVVVLFNSGHYLSVVNSDLRNVIYSIFFILTFALPALFIPILYYFRIITNLKSNTKKEKLIPMGAVLIIYALAYYFMQKVNMPPILLNIIISSIVVVALCTVVTLFWSISIHLAALGGVFGFVMFIGINSKLDLLFIGLLIIVVSGLVASSQLFLQKHNPMQVYGGFLIGFICVYLSMMFF
ncbi:MAG: phosphatase PAP2 family protein [Bacteroidales bacterium]|nr:phosphatase PAP2 family protein [Bacteroidales bacterium]